MTSPSAHWAPLVLHQSLSQRMAAALATGSGLLYAPAGWGKTSVLAALHDHLAGSGNAVCWAPASEDLGQALATARGTRAVLLIDDVDKRPADSVEALGKVLLDDGGVRVVLATTVPLVFGVQRLSMAGRLQVWRSRDLAVEPDDVVALLGQPRGSPDLAREISAWAEGWLTGVAFAARSGEAPRALPVEIENYFAETGYDRLDTREAGAVAVSGLLDGFDRALAADVTGADVISIAQAAGLPLLEVAEQPGLWRWHRLYRLFLRERAGGLGRGRTRAAHACAADLLADAGRHADSAAHAIESGDGDLAAAAIDRGARAFIAEGRIADALTWFGGLTPGDRARHPRIGLFRAVALILAGLEAEAAKALAETRALCASAQVTRPDWLSEVEHHARFQTELNRFFFDASDPGLDTIDVLIADTSDDHPVVHGEALLLRGLLCERRGDWPGAIASMDRAEALLGASASWYALACGVALHAEALVGEGAPERARLRLTAFMQQVVEAAGPDVAALAITRTCLAEVAWCMGDDEGAQAELAILAPMLRNLRNAEVDARVLLLRARLARADGGHDAAAELAAQALTTVPARAILLTARIRSLSAIVAQERGAHHEAGALVELDGAPARVQASRPSQDARARTVLALARARLLVARGGVLGPRLTEVAEASRSLGLAGERIEAKVATAVHLAMSGDRERALRALSEAASDARRLGLTRALIDHGGPIHAALLNEAGVQEGQGRVCTQFVDATTQDADVDLTSKEQEVLALIAAGLSNSQIAGEMFASVATIKWHVRNLLAKLEVPSRSAATARARSLRLLR